MYVRSETVRHVFFNLRVDILTSYSCWDLAKSNNAHSIVQLLLAIAEDPMSSNSDWKQTCVPFLQSSLATLQSEFKEHVVFKDEQLPKISEIGVHKLRGAVLKLPLPEEFDKDNYVRVCALIVSRAERQEAQVALIGVIR